MGIQNVNECAVLANICGKACEEPIIFSLHLTTLELETTKFTTWNYSCRLGEFIGTHPEERTVVQLRSFCHALQNDWCSVLLTYSTTMLLQYREKWYCKIKRYVVCVALRQSFIKKPNTIVSNLGFRIILKY